MFKIGMIGPDFLLQRNAEILQQLQAKYIALQQEAELSQIDGLLITGWKRADYLRPLQRLQPAIRKRAEQLCLLGIAAGAAPLGQSGACPVIDYAVSLRPSRGLTTAILEFPCFGVSRFTAAFLPDVRFHHLAPNLAILCQHSRHGPVVVRQGNHLACSFVAELTPQPDLYAYWLEMVAALKNSREF